MVGMAQSLRESWLRARSVPSNADRPVWGASVFQKEKTFLEVSQRGSLDSVPAHLPMIPRSLLFVPPRTRAWRDFMSTVNVGSYECLRVFLQTRYAAHLVENSDLLIISFPDESTKIQFTLTYGIP